MLDDSRAPFYRWFVGGEINTCYNALDRHVEEGHGDSVGLIYDSPLGNAKRTYTFAEMCNATANIAGALIAKGVGRGDRVGYLYANDTGGGFFHAGLCAYWRRPHGGFWRFWFKELAARIDDGQAKYVISASCGIEPGRLVDYKTCWMTP